MKTYTIFGLLTLLIASGCSSTQWADNSYYDDDLYYKPKSQPIAVDDSYAPIQKEKTLQKEDRQDLAQLKNDYNKSELAVEDNRNFSQIQAEYMDLLTNDSINQVDSLLYFNEETGYWVDGFEGSAMDQDYAERLIKFHGPFNGIPYWSPLYNDLIYFNSWDWNVYVDGNYAYAFPTWSNPWYNDYRFNFGYNNPWRWNFSMSWGWGYPYCGRYGWYDPWYSPWCDPWYYPYYGHHHHHYPWYGGGYYPPYYGGGGGGIAVRKDYKPRGGQATSVRPGGNSTNMVNRSTGGRTGIKNNTYQTTTPNRESYQVGNSRITFDDNKGRTITNTNTGRTYTYINRQNNNTTKSVNQQSGNSNNANQRVGTSRRGYTPTYSNSRSSSSRSSYNRTSTYTRPSTTRSSGSSSRSSVTKSTNRSYSGSSGRSSSYRNSGSSSSYSPSRSSGSTSRSSYTPSRSSSSSSGSSYRSSSSRSSSGSSYRSSSGSSSRSSGSSGGSSRSSGGGSSRSGGGRR